MKNRISRPKLSESWSWFFLLLAFLLALWQLFANIVLYEYLPLLPARIIMMIGCGILGAVIGYVSAHYTDG